MMDTLSVLAQRAGENDDWWGHMHGWSGGWMWLWGTLMMLSWWRSSPLSCGSSAARVTTPDRAVPERSSTSAYARRELTTAEFCDRLEELR